MAETLKDAILDFNITKPNRDNPLEIEVKDISRQVPANATVSWDFGDFRELVEAKPGENITHVYDKPGFYLITMKYIIVETGEEKSVNDTIGLNNLAKTTLADSIYNLIDSYIPDDLVSQITKRDKRTYIEKWQLYMQPIVNHEVPLEDYNNEFYYEALENQLIMEAAAYDWLTVGIMNMMRSISNQVEDSSTGGETEVPDVNNEDRVKKIVTGPSEVEFFDPVLSGEEASKLAKTITSAMQPGGLLDTLKENLCMLASRVEVFLPICNSIKRVTVPKVVDRRRNRKDSFGPNPMGLLKK